MDLKDRILDLVIAIRSKLNGKQAILVSGTNIKTINGASVLGTGNIAIAGGGGGSATLTEVEVDFGASPVSSAKFVLADALAVPTNKIIAFTSPNPATDRVGNDWEVDSCQLTGVSNTGNISIFAVSLWPIMGKRKIYYQILN